MPDPPPAAAFQLPLTPLTVPPLAAAGSTGPWANDLFPAVLLLALGASLVALGAWIVRPPPRPPRGGNGDGGPKRRRGPRRDRRPPRSPGGPGGGFPAHAADPVRRPVRPL